MASLCWIWSGKGLNSEELWLWLFWLYVEGTSTMFLPKGVHFSCLFWWTDLIDWCRFCGARHPKWKNKSIFVRIRVSFSQTSRSCQGLLSSKGLVDAKTFSTGVCVCLPKFLFIGSLVKSPPCNLVPGAKWGKRCPCFGNSKSQLQTLWWEKFMCVCVWKFAGGCEYLAGMCE